MTHFTISLFLTEPFGFADLTVMLPVPELGVEVQVRGDFNLIATTNDRDRGVNDLSSALRRRFNTVVLPLPDSAEEEVAIVLTFFSCSGIEINSMKMYCLC